MCRLPVCTYRGRRFAGPTLGTAQGDDPGWNNVSIRGDGTAVTMIGGGRDRGAFTQRSVNQGTTPWRSRAWRLL